MLTIPSFFIMCLVVSVMVIFNFENKKSSLETKKSKDKKNPIIFTGDSIIYSWRTLQKDFEPLHVLNRGFPGITINDLTNTIDDLLLKFNPKSIVIYAGSNEIRESTNHTAKEILEDFKSITTRISEKSSGITIFYISILPSMAKSMWINRSDINKTNALIKEFCSTHENLHFLDVESYFRYSSGLAKLKYYEKDRFHLNEKGYKLLSAVIIRYLQIK